MIDDERIRRVMEQMGWDKLSKEELTDAVSRVLASLVQMGLAEQLVGEDGEFYYRSISR